MFSITFQTFNIDVHCFVILLGICFIWLTVYYLYQNKVEANRAICIKLRGETLNELFIAIPDKTAMT